MSTFLIAHGFLEGGGCGEHDGQAFIALGEIDAEGCRERAMKPEAEAGVGFQAVEIQVAPVRRHLPASKNTAVSR